MSDEVLAPMIAVAILAGLLLWIPTLEMCSDRCQRILRGRAQRRQEDAALDAIEAEAKLSKAG